MTAPSDQEMTSAEYAAEYRYRVEERLGIMLGDLKKPTSAETAYAQDAARKEAAAAMDELERLEQLPCSPTS